MSLRVGVMGTLGLPDPNTIGGPVLVRRPHRASGDLALHRLEIMHARLHASKLGRHVEIESRPERPEALPVAAGEEELR